MSQHEHTVKSSIHYLPEIVSFLVMFFAEITPALISIGFIIIIDTLTGAWAAKKRGERVESRKAGRVLTKLIIYPLAIIVSKVAQEYLAPVIPWVDVTAGIIATVEVKSIFENSGDILGYDLWKKVKEAMWKDRLGEFSEEDPDKEKSKKDKTD